MINNDLNRCFSFLMGVVLKIKSYPAGYNEYAAPILINYYYYSCSGVQMSIIYAYYILQLTSGHLGARDITLNNIIIIVPTDNAF